MPDSLCLGLLTCKMGKQPRTITGRVGSEWLTHGSHTDCWPVLRVSGQ